MLEERAAGLTVVNTSLDAITTTSPEPKDLSLAKAPLTIASQRLGDGLEVMAAFGTRLNTDNLYRFLKRASGDKFDPGIYDAVSDARYVDRESWTTPNSYYGAKKEDGIHYSLDEMHRGLGEAWTISEAHRTDVLQALEDADPGTKQLVPPQINVGYVTRSEIVKSYTGQLINNARRSVTNDLLKHIFGQLNEDELKDMIKRSRSKHGLTRNEKKMSVDQLRRRVLFKAHSAPRFRNNLMASSQWQEMVDRAADERYYAATFEQDGEELTFYRKKDSDDGAMEDKIEPTITRRFNDHDVVYMAQVRATGLVYLKTEVIPNNPQPSLVPLIHVVEHDGHLQLQTGPVNDHPLLTAITESQPNLLGDHTKADSLLGLLTVAYFSPDITKAWPDKMPSPHGVRAQRVGPLQVLVEGSMRRIELSQSKLVSTLVSSATN